jgi:HD-GYP domain-containing protein (c-di-GMP phosphodiesterase class II)
VTTHEWTDLHAAVLIPDPYVAQTGGPPTRITFAVVAGATPVINVLGRLGGAIELLDRRDPSSARHRRAVARYSLAIATAAGFSHAQRELLRRAALLHDVGKLALPARVLAGAAPLCDDEWELIRAHPGRGGMIISLLDGGDELAAVVATHHERVDGRGYPRGLKGAEIPALARIVAVAEAYDAMTGEGGYRRPMHPVHALRRLSKASGTQLEPRFVEILVGALAAGDLR